MATILVVDDASLTRLLLEVMLQRLNHTVLFADNGEEALEILASREVQLVISDINMPYMDGLALLDVLRADDLHQDLPVVMMTASGLEEISRNALKKGASAFLHQPFSSWDLARTLDACLVKQ
jgi:two-component system, chemotaxis family, chemotaxis protein CheY